MTYDGEDCIQMAQSMNRTNRVLAAQRRSRPSLNASLAMATRNPVHSRADFWMATAAMLGGMFAFSPGLRRATFLFVAWIF